MSAVLVYSLLATSILSNNDRSSNAISYVHKVATQMNYQYEDIVKSLSQDFDTHVSFQVTWDFGILVVIILKTWLRDF